MNLEFSGQILEKYSNIKFHENSSSESRVVPGGEKGGRKDRFDEANRPFSYFCEHADKTVRFRTTALKSACDITFTRASLGGF